MEKKLEFHLLHRCFTHLCIAFFATNAMGMDGWLVGWLVENVNVVLCCVVLIQSSSQPMVMVTSFQNQYE